MKVLKILYLIVVYILCLSNAFAVLLTKNEFIYQLMQTGKTYEEAEKISRHPTVVDMFNAYKATQKKSMEMPEFQSTGIMFFVNEKVGNACTVTWIGD